VKPTLRFTEVHLERLVSSERLVMGHSPFVIGRMANDKRFGPSLSLSAARAADTNRRSGFPQIAISERRHLSSGRPGTGQAAKQRCGLCRRGFFLRRRTDTAVW
jgi:hypothetical protein